MPVSRGGRDDDDNLVCTSQLRNSAKGTWLLEELGWKLHPAGILDDWDGMLSWFVGYVERHPGILDDRHIRQWHAAACHPDIGRVSRSAGATGGHVIDRRCQTDVVQGTG